MIHQAIAVSKSADDGAFHGLYRGRGPGGGRAGFIIQLGPVSPDVHSVGKKKKKKREINWAMII